MNTGPDENGGRRLTYSGMTISIHDHRVRELTILAAERTIRLVTGYPEMTGPQRAEALFEGVEAYAFNGDALGTVLFDIEALDPVALYREWATQMRQTYSKSGGHAPWVASDSEAVAFLSRGDIRGYRVSSSIGLEGAVWARGLTFRAPED